MTPTQLRQALRELNGERDAKFSFASVASVESILHVANAMLIPDEPDHLVKVTDGTHVYIIDAERVAYVGIALKKTIK
jgi:hypothetical protein